MNPTKFKLNKAKKFAKQQASEVYQCKASRFANTKFN